ncbi:methyltransferase domain-containing protein [Streptomyces sp. NPDC050560]|uniref:methyltransferase domain-containing protein n=1 Tax=Streptomyces sp. NPDC050560 TaxID=3365630 RepID=UPI0037A78385
MMSNEDPTPAQESPRPGPHPVDAHVPAPPGEHHDAFAALFDPVTFRHLDELGVGPGWRCWAAAAGGRSVVDWLAKRVGPTGRVLATCPGDAAWTASARPPVEVRRHDLAVDLPPGEGFDLVHARLALAAVPDPEKTLFTLADALRPGGRLLIEEADVGLQPLTCPDEHGDAQRLANRLRAAVRTLAGDRGEPQAHGRALPRMMRAAGLHHVHADGHLPLASVACSVLETATIRHVRPALVAAGLATDEDVDLHLTHVAAGAMDVAAVPLVSAWGRRPRTVRGEGT